MGNIIQVLKNGFYCSYSHFFPSKKSCKRLGLKFRERIRKVKFSCHNINIFFTLHYIKKCKSIVFDQKNMNHLFENDPNLGDFSPAMFALPFSFGALFGRILNI